MYVHSHDVFYISHLWLKRLLTLLLYWICSSLLALWWMFLYNLVITKPLNHWGLFHDIQVNNNLFFRSANYWCDHQAGSDGRGDGCTRHPGEQATATAQRWDLTHTRLKSLYNGQSDIYSTVDENLTSVWLFFFFYWVFFLSKLTNSWFCERAHSCWGSLSLIHIHTQICWYFIRHPQTWVTELTVFFVFVL